MLLNKRIPIIRIRGGEHTVKKTSISERSSFSINNSILLVYEWLLCRAGRMFSDIFLKCGMKSGSNFIYHS